MAVVKDKKDVSVLIETQFPEFVTEKHPKFKKFVEKYYEFMESHQLYFGTTFTFNEPKIVDESDGTSYILREDGAGCGVQLESTRDTENDANVQFTIGETLTGNTSEATAVVTGTKGNTVAFIKPTNSVSFKYGEKVTGDTSRAYATLANGVVDGTFPKGSVESFRSRGATAAVKELPESQDIDLANEGLIDLAWKKEFYVNIPKTATTDRRQLLKQMKEVYRSKGNEASFKWLFRALYATTVGHIPGLADSAGLEFYYPKTDLMRVSDGRWKLDKSIKILTGSANNITVFTGKKITGSDSKCTAMVEKQNTYFAGPLEVTELFLSNIVQGVVDNELFFFITDETITSEADVDGLIATGETTGIVQNITVDVGGTDYIVGDEIHINAGGGDGARARVSAITTGVVDGITIIDSGDGYVVGDPLTFINQETGGNGAAGSVATIIKTAEFLKNTDLLQTDVANSFRLIDLNDADYGASLTGHNANTHLFGNSSLVFSASIKYNGADTTAKYYNDANTSDTYDATKHILAGDRIAKVTSINNANFHPEATVTSRTITQYQKNVTLSAGLSEEEKLDIIGGKLTYANANINIITGFSSNTVLQVRDSHAFGVPQTFSIEYSSNTYWGTIISANTTAILYSVGSHYRESDLDALTVQNFVNDDNIIIYDSKFTKLGANAAASGVDAHNMHNGVTFQIGNTPASQVGGFEMLNAHGAQADPVLICNGALNMTSVNVGAIDTFTITSGGSEYKKIPPVSVANNYIQGLGNALDIVGSPNALLNLNLHSYSTGTIAQYGNTVTLDSDGTFPDANSGVLTLTYANGTTDKVTAVTNSSTIKVSSQKIFGQGWGGSPDRETYSLSYMALANNFTKNTLLYNDDYSARGRILDFIDRDSADLKLSTVGHPVIANGNTTLRVDMTTTQDFGGAIEHILLESKSYHKDSYGHQKLLLEDIITSQGPHSGLGSAQGGGGFFLIETSVEFLTQENGTTDSVPGDVVLAEDESRFYTESLAGERVTAHSNSVSTYTTGTITQSGTTVTGVGTVFPNDFVRGTITYADDATSTITGHTNATSFTVEDSKTIGSGQAYSISYNPVLTWGANREVTVLADGIGNRTVTVTDVGHHLRTGDKVKITGSDTAIFNGVFPITANLIDEIFIVLEDGTYIQFEDEAASILSEDYDPSSTFVKNNTYIYTLPENTTVSSPTGNTNVTMVASAWLATSNTVTMDTAIKGNNAVIEVSSLVIGAIKSATIYNFGGGYDTTPVLTTTSGNRDAVLTASLGALATYGGYYVGTTGLLSGIPKIQDNKYYQAFSYVLKTDFDVQLYRNAVKKLTHPSGLLMFGELAMRLTADTRMFNAAAGTVDDLGTIIQPGPDNEGRKYHNITVPAHNFMVATHQSFGSNNELEIYTADHPWQAMDASLETWDDVRFQLEAYDEVDSITRIDYYNYRVEQTLHGFETGDVVAFSEVHHPIHRPATTNITMEAQVPIKEEDSRNDVILMEAANTFVAMEEASSIIERVDGWSGQITGQEWQGEHQVTTLSTNTYAITTTKDFGTVPEQVMYDGNLYIQLENQASGNTIVTEDYEFEIFVELEYFTVNRVGDQLLLEDSTVENPNRIITEIEGSVSQYNLMMEPTDYLKAKTVSFANTSRATSYNWDDPYSGVLIGQDRPTVTLFCSTTSGNTTITTTDTAPLLIGMTVRGAGIPTTPAPNVATITNSTTFELSEKAIATSYVPVSCTFDQEFEMLVESGGTFLYPKLQFPEAETGTVSIDMSFNSDLLLEDDNGAYGWGYILTEDSGAMGNGPQRYVSLEDSSQYPTTNTAQYIRTERQYNYIQFEVELEDDSGYILLEDSSGIIIAVEPVTTGYDLTYSNPYMESTADISLIGNLGYHLITESAVVFQLESAIVLLMEDDDILVQENTIHALTDKYGRTSNRTAGGAFHIEDTEFGDIIVQENTTSNRDVGGAFYIEDTEFGDIIDSEENLRTYWTVGLEASKAVYVDGNENGVFDSLLTEAGDFIEYELNSAIFWEDPHEIYSHITVPTNLLLEHNSWAIRQSAPVYQYIDRVSSLGRLIYEDGNLIANEVSEMKDGETEDESYFYLEADIRALEVTSMPQVEIDLQDSMGSHIITEDYEHLIVEDDNTSYNPIRDRFITGEPHFKTSTHEIEYRQNKDPGLPRPLPAVPHVHYANNVLQDWEDTSIATVTYGMQAFRPHYYSQWASADLGFIDDKFRMEDNTGIILLEHPVTNQDRLIQEDFPGLYEDIMNPLRDRLDLILLETQPGWLIDGDDNSYLISEEGDSAVVNPKQSGVRLALESTLFGPNAPEYLAVEIELEDSTGRVSLENGIAPGIQGYAYYSSNLILEEDLVDNHTAHQVWTVLPAYQYSRIPTRLQGLISIADGGTTVTGSEYCNFTTQLKVGEEFQTEDVRIVAEDSGGDIALESNERLEHEDITLGDASAFVLESVKAIRFEDFRWLLSSEDSTIASHYDSSSTTSHANVLGVYLERELPLVITGTADEAIGLNPTGSNIGDGGDEASGWDTNDESFWFLTHETNDGLGITRVDSGTTVGAINRESLEWENNNMIWEDFSKQLIIEPQAFIVGSITNDASLTVTRKHLGGIEDAEYRL